MTSARLLLVLCLIVLTETACARRSARVVRIPAGPAAASDSTAQKSERRDPARQVRDAIRSLKERVKSKPQIAREEPAGPTASTVVPPGTVPSDPKVGTSGAWSVETRYPIAQPGSDSGGAGPPQRNRLLTRAGRAAREAGSGTWAGLVALGVVAAVLVALAVRRTRTTS